MMSNHDGLMFLSPFQKQNCRRPSRFPRRVLEMIIRKKSVDENNSKQ